MLTHALVALSLAATAVPDRPWEPAQSPVDRCEADGACRYLCPPGRHCGCYCGRGDFYRPDADRDPPPGYDRRPVRPQRCPPRDVACDFNPNDPCCWR